MWSIYKKNEERIQKFKEAGDSRYNYQNKLDQACFQHGMAYGDFKDLIRRAASDKILRDKVFNIARKPRYDGYKRDLAAIVFQVFDKKNFDNGVKNENNSDNEIAEE